MSETINVIREDAPEELRMAQPPETNNLPLSNSFASSKASDASPTGKGEVHVRSMEPPDAITTYQNSLSCSAENLPLSIEPDTASRLNTLSDAGIDLSRLDVTDPNFDVYKWATETLSKANKSKFKYRRASVAFVDLNVSGSSSGGSDTQATVASILALPRGLRNYSSLRNASECQILSSLNGLIKHGEMLLVLGRPGSGCSTFLKTIAGQLAGLKVDPRSHVGYNGSFWSDIS